MQMDWMFILPVVGGVCFLAVMSWAMYNFVKNEEDYRRIVSGGLIERPSKKTAARKEPT